jgi:uncharacterized protein YodC (DUF2158 family)
MQLSDFNTGDVVQLRESGPAMTVETVVNDQAALAVGIQYGVHCVWFDQRNELHRAVFHPSLLNKVDHQAAA